MIRDAAALGAANLCFLAAGIGFTRPLGLWSRPSDLPRVLGIAYMAGVAIVGVLATLGLLAGLSLEAWQILVACALLAALAAKGRDRALPPGIRAVGKTRPIVGSIVASLGVYLAFLLARSYAEPVRHWDAWSFWTAKARAIITLGGLDTRYFAGDVYRVFHLDYPLFVPALEAIDFQFMGRITTHVIHLQFWCLLVGFLVCTAQLLRDRVEPVVLWPALLLVGVAPSVSTQLGWAIAELPLAFYFALAALTGWRYVESGDRRYAALLAVFAAAALLTKREAMPFVAALFLLLVVFAVLRHTRVRPVLWAGAGALVGIGPWWIWVAEHHVEPRELAVGKTVDPGWLLSRTDRLPPVLARLPVEALRPSAWIVILPLFLLAAALALRRNHRGVGGFLLILVALMFVSLVWAYWTDVPEIHGHVRRTGRRVVTTPLILCAVFLPLVVAELSSGTSRGRTPP
jgi:hypothetical protein